MAWSSTFSDIFENESCTKTTGNIVQSYSIYIYLFSHCHMAGPSTFADFQARHWVDRRNRNLTEFLLYYKPIIKHCGGSYTRRSSELGSSIENSFRSPVFTSIFVSIGAVLSFCFFKADVNAPSLKSLVSLLQFLLRPSLIGHWVRAKQGKCKRWISAQTMTQTNHDDRRGCGGIIYKAIRWKYKDVYTNNSTRKLYPLLCLPQALSYFSLVFALHTRRLRLIIRYRFRRLSPSFFCCL